MKFPSVGLVAFTLVISPLSGGTWNYDFTTQGINPADWSFVNDFGSFSYTTSGAGATVYTTGTSGGFSTGKLSLNLAQFPTITDFSISATFTGGNMDEYLHQIQLETNYDNGGSLLLARSTETGHSVNLFAGSSPFAFYGVDPAGGISAPATFTMTLTGTTYTAAWNGYTWWTSDPSPIAPLTSVYLALNNNNGANGPNSVTWQSFSITSPAIPEPSTYAALAGLGALGLVLWQRRRRSGGT